MKNDYKSLILERLKELRSDNTVRLNNSYYINEAIKPFKLLKEDSDFSGKINPENPNEVIWDNLESNIKKSTEGVNTLDKAKEYFTILHNKVKDLPRNVKKKAFNAAIIGLGALMLTNIAKTQDELVDELPTDVKASVVNIDNPVIKTIKDVKPEVKAEVKIRSVSDTLVNFLKDEEGSPKKKGEPVLTAYDIGDGAVTIGWGHAERKSDTKMVPGKTKISVEKAEQLLNKDIKWASDRLNTILNDWDDKGIKVNVTQGMYDSMVSLIFNMGIGNFRKSKLVRLIKANKLKEAKELIKSTHITYPGHKIRRAKESEMFNITT